MPDEARRRDKLVGLFVAGAMLLNPPLLSLVGGSTIAGWPTLFIYIFVVWALVIAALALAVEGRRHPPDPPDGQGGT
jgi:hypothetical protein